MTLDISKDFIVLSPDKEATIEKFSSGFYEYIDRKYKGFKGHELISAYEFDEDWSSWERHPNGDEIVILLTGQVTFILDTEAGERSVKLTEPGSYVIVPMGIWHTARTNVTSKMLFITPGEATEHKAR